jgi:hypothetical protein
VIGPLAVATHVLSLAIAAWAFVEFFRGREALVLVQVAVLAARVAGGHRPAGGDMVTLVGYLLTAALLPPAGIVLARMEPTRWGSLLLGAATVIVPVLILRLGQIWNG